MEYSLTDLNADRHTYMCLKSGAYERPKGGKGAPVYVYDVLDQVH